MEVQMISVRDLMNGYVDNGESGKVWVYTIYAGDKELMKELHTPIRFEDPEKELMNYLNELKQ